MAAPCWPLAEELRFSPPPRSPAPSARCRSSPPPSLLAPDSTASDGAGSARTLYVIMAVIGVLIVLGVLARPRSRPPLRRPRRRRGAAPHPRRRLGPGPRRRRARRPRAGPLRRRHRLHREDHRGRGLGRRQRPDHDPGRRPAVALALRVPGRRGDAPTASPPTRPTATTSWSSRSTPPINLDDQLDRRPASLVGPGARTRRRRRARDQQRDLLHRRLRPAPSRAPRPGSPVPATRR